MKEDGWEKAKRIFADAIKLAPELRLQYLNEVCADDAETRREVESLLSSYGEAESFMETPAAKEYADVIKSSGKKLEIGKCFGHYEIIEQIGAGGMGEVYLAKDQKLDRKVAVKILNEKFSRHESNLARFTQEAKAASGLNHPNILVIHEIGDNDEVYYIVSEYIEGKTLREIFKESTMKLTEVLDIATQIASALVAAHKAGIVHRDIKPENIIIRPDGYAKILDFGLAKLVEQKGIGLEESTVKQNQTAKGVILGTVNYMSPEQAKSERVDQRTDIFSLGVVIYEMLTGRTPFAGGSVSETFANLINTGPQPLSRFVANVPDELQRIVSKMLRKNAETRYQKMKDVLMDLKDLRENLTFDEKLERSAQSGEKATEVLHATTGAANIQTAETRNSFLQKIRQHKLLAAFVLASVLIGGISFGYYFFYTGKTSLSADGKKTLAVLPFVNASQDPNTEYLSDGITESIINNLSQISGLKVMSRNSAFRFKQNQTDTKNIAWQLGVETLVTGDIKQIGDKLVINIRLIDANDDSQIWGNQYVRTNADIITAQNEIAQAVANNLRVKLSNSERQQLAKSYTDNAEAYQLYLKGRYHTLKRTLPETQRAISYFQQAIELDPSYALAYAGLADAYRSALASDLSPTEFLPQSKSAAQKAVEIDDALADGHAELGFSIFWNDWDWQSAENQFKRALEIDPNKAETYVYYAHLLSNTGRHTEALAEAKRAREIDPLNLLINSLEAQFLIHAGQTDEALARLQKTFELEPNYYLAHLFASSAYIEKEMYGEAINEARKAIEISRAGNSHPSGFLSYALAKSGKETEARTELEDLLKSATKRYVSPYRIALIYNGLGERDEALDWLERAYQQRDQGMVFLKVEPKWNNLRSEPRFVALMKQMNFE